MKQFLWKKIDYKAKQNLTLGRYSPLHISHNAPHPPPPPRKKKKIAEELFSVSLGRLYYTRKMKNKGYAKLGGKYGELREMCKWRIGHLNCTVFLPLGPEFISFLLSYLKPRRILIVVVIKFILSCKWTIGNQ